MYSLNIFQTNVFYLKNGRRREMFNLRQKSRYLGKSTEKTGSL